MNTNIQPHTHKHGERIHTDTHKQGERTHTHTHKHYHISHITLDTATERLSTAGPPAGRPHTYNLWV